MVWRQLLWQYSSVPSALSPPIAAFRQQSLWQLAWPSFFGRPLGGFVGTGGLSLGEE